VLSRNGKVIEVPIKYEARKRKEGKKLSWKHGVKCLWVIFKIKISLI
ncbi:MAG: glycosyl transferase, partial [Candidatus Niyogibacteria bacterium CG10_big_fil_rev_8_21_14_0_10_42_19]